MPLGTRTEAVSTGMTATAAGSPIQVNAGRSNNATGAGVSAGKADKAPPANNNSGGGNDIFGSVLKGLSDMFGSIAQALGGGQ